MRTYLDDERVTPEGRGPVFWPDEATALIETGEVAEISLDHDLGDDARGTGYDVIVWIEEAAVTRGFRPPAIGVHAANPSARLRMEAGIRAIGRASQA
ncbi:cyclic-phosphate processing receiver domain-containing protein [Lysobacter sp. 1R34A]|uniref:cyclic-phosphate processing receiver domain-containing protein n=1 Tax=Lysobacter sp. 1R34A TaxID=3445786 RepID=UPI003EEC2B31